MNTASTPPVHTHHVVVTDTGRMEREGLTMTTDDPTTERIRVLMARKGWTNNETARYLGVPYGTFGNWIQGTKKPSKVVTRLLEVLGVVEALAPHIHTHLKGE